MSSVGHRWQAGMGAISGALLADAFVESSSDMADQRTVGQLPESSETHTWGDRGARLIDQAEAHLRGQVPQLDLDPIGGLGIAIAFADSAPSLLADAATAELFEVVSAALNDPAQARDRAADLVDPDLARANALSAHDFTKAVTADCERHVAVLAGALVGLFGGIGAVPARPLSRLRTAHARPGRRYLSRLTDRLLGVSRNDWYDPRSCRGPRQVLPGLWLSNLLGLRSFVREHPEGLVLSLCDIEGRLDDHDAQITFHVDDTPKADANPSLGLVLDQVLDEIRTARSQDRPVLVHCRHGASRTGLVLRAVLVETEGLDADQALVEAQCLWDHTSEWNTAWAKEIERRSPRECS